MNLKEITITAEASKAYQKYCVALTAQDLNDGDIEFLKQMAISEAVKGIDILAGNVETKPEVKVSQQPVKVQTQTQYRPQQNTYQNQGFQQRNTYTGQQFKPVSEPQIKYLKGLGYTGPIPQSWEEANQILQQLKAERGIQ